MFLAVYYAPMRDHTYDSIQFIEQPVMFGVFVLGPRHLGASGMVIAIGPNLSFVGDTRNFD